ncbi:hypothetical protein ACSSS7_003522 [Eimeria intestinalis]
MFVPLREALMKRIAACAPEEEVGALISYYSELINYNCLGGKLMRGLLTVYASLAATHKLHFHKPTEASAEASAAATSASAAAAPYPYECSATTAAAAPAATQAASPAATQAASPAATQTAAPAATRAAPSDAATKEAFSSPVCYLGWGVELLQSAFLVADDQMDGASTRRGKMCWYRKPEIGAANAINDSVFLIFAIHQVMHEFLGNHEALIACVDLLQQVAFKTVLGQHLDTNGHVHLLQQQQHQQQQQQQQQQQHQDAAAAEAMCRALANQVRSRQAAAARLKTSYYSFWLPTALGDKNW